MTALDVRSALTRRWQQLTKQEDAPRVSARLEGSAARAFSLLIDAEQYPEWLVGAQRIRTVDPAWPAPGTEFEHVVGLGPLRLQGRTVAVAIDPPHGFVIEAGIGFLGELLVSFELEERHGSTDLTITERPTSGVVAQAWRFGGAPLIRWLLWGRNRLSVDQLASISAEST